MADNLELFIGCLKVG